MLLYLIVFILLVAIELLYFRIADRFNIIDKPNLRSSHTHITLRGGGIIFIIAMWLYTLIYGLNYPWFLLGLTAIAGISFVDDIHSVPNRIRIIIQFLAMLLMIFQWDIIRADDWWMILTALVLCVGIINAFNFMDGINGITGGYSLAILIPLWILNNRIGFIDADFLVVTMISVVVFCFFNFRKRAKCFAGDVGSVGIAFILLFALGKLVLLTNDLSYLVLFAVYGVDSVLTIAHRLMLKENVFEAHRKHAYQIMANELKMPHVLVSSIYMIIQLVVSAGIIWCPINHWMYLSAIIIIFSGGYITFMRKYFHLHMKWLTSRNN